MCTRILQVFVCPSQSNLLLLLNLQRHWEVAFGVCPVFGCNQWETDCIGLTALAGMGSPALIRFKALTMLLLVITGTLVVYRTQW